MTEMIHDARIVPLDNRPALNDDIRLWTGDSRGYWEGDTLVIETKNFNNLTQSFSVYGSAEDKLLTERFTRTGPFTMEYEYTLEDPSTFADRIQVMTVMSRVDGQLYEYACHEGNYNLAMILAGARRTDWEKQQGLNQQ